jgi:hypothetical protein
MKAFWLVLFLGLPCFAQLQVDGVRIGMSYAQVLQARGLPSAIGVKGELWYLVYAAPKSRPEETSVWFAADRVVYASGYTLEKNGEPFFLYGLEGSVLRDELGAPQVLSVFARWWPESGIVLAGSNNIWPDEVLRAPMGLRDPDFPIEWDQHDGHRWSLREPWVDDERVEWLAGDVALGMAEKRARKLARGLEVEYAGGFVRAVRHPASVLLSHHVGYHDFSVQLEVGELPLAVGITPALPMQGWTSPAPGGLVRMAGGKVAEIALELQNDKLFAALSAMAGKEFQSLSSSVACPPAKSWCLRISQIVVLAHQPNRGACAPVKSQ